MKHEIGIPAAFKADWDQVEAGWWYRVVGQFEVHLSLDPDLGWEISVQESGLMKSRPVFRKELSVAITVAETLFAHYQVVGGGVAISISETV